MYHKGYYRGMSEERIAAELGCEGLTPKRIHEVPGSRYHTHRNADDLVIAFIDGSADIRIGDRLFTCRAGDRLEIDGDREHSAQIGPYGCTYLMTPVPTYAD